MHHCRTDQFTYLRAIVSGLQGGSDSLYVQRCALQKTADLYVGERCHV